MSELQLILNAIAQLDSKITALDAKVNALDTKFDTKINALDTKVNAVDAKVAEVRGLMVEANLRPQVAIQFGRKYASEFTAKSLSDIVKLTQKCDFDELKRKTQSLAAAITSNQQELLPKFVAKLGSKLQAVEDLPKGLLARWQTLVEGSGNFGEVLGPVIGALKSLEDGRQNGDDLPFALRELCEKLQAYKRDPTSLATCSGLGLPLLVFWASPNQELKNSLQFDVRGKVAIIRNHATIEVGEIKATSKGFKKARQQLLLRIRTLHKALQILCPNIDQYVLIGRIFYSGRKRKPQDSVEQLVEPTMTFSTYYHHMSIV